MKQKHRLPLAEQLRIAKELNKEMQGRIERLEARAVDRRRRTNAAAVAVQTCRMMANILDNSLSILRSAKPDDDFEEVREADDDA